MNSTSGNHKSLSLLEGVSEMVFRISTLNGEILEFFAPEHINLWLPRDQIVGFNVLKLKGMKGLDDLNSNWINGDKQKVLNETHELEVNNKVYQVSFKRTGKKEIFAILKEITIQKRNELELEKKEKLILDVERGISSSTGSNFFNHLAIYCAKALESDYAMIAEYWPNENKNRTLAVCNKDKIIENFEYDLTGAPCEQMLEHSPIVYKKNVAKKFSKFKLLKELKIEGYIGIPLYSEKNEKLGVLVGLYTNPLEDVKLKLKVLQLFSGRSSGEIERLKVNRLLQNNEKKYKNLYHNTPGMFHSVNANDEIIDVGEYWLKKMGYSRHEVLGRKSIEFLCEEYWDYANNVALPRFFKDGFLKDIEYKFLTKEGKKLDVLLSAVLEKSEDNIKALVILNDVTAIKTAKQKIQESEKKYREIFNSITDIYYKTDSEGILTLISPSIEQYSGYKPEDLIGKPSSEFLLQSKENSLVRERIIAGEKISNIEVNGINKNGEIKSLSINLNGDFDSKGTYIGTTGIIRDVTEHDKMVDLIKESATKYKDLFDHYQDAVFISDLETEKFIDVNPAALKLLGYEKEEIIGKSTFRFSAKRKKSNTKKLYSSLLNKGETLYESDIVKKNGAVITVEGSLRVVNLNNQKVVQDIVRDISDRRKHEIRLSESEKKYRSLFEDSSDAVIIIDSKSKLILDANQSMEQILGFSKEELVSKTIFDLRDKKKYLHAVSLFNNVLKQGSLLYQTSLITKDKKEIDVEGSANVLKLDGKKVVQTFLRDISDRKREEKISHLNKSILEKLARENDIYDILNSTCLGLEDIDTDMICSVLIYDEVNNWLNYGAGPKLPKYYTKAVDNFPVGPNCCSCGTAVYYRKTTIVSDIQNDPLWESKRELASKAKLSACWSIPMLSSKNKVLGTFAIYFREPRKPKKHELELINDFGKLVGIALENNKNQKDLILNEKKYRQLVDHSPIAILIHTKGIIKFVNKEVLRIGKAQNESQLIGKGVMDFVIPQFKKEVEVRIKKTQDDKKTLPRMEEQFLCLDKSIIDVEVMGTPVTYQGLASTQLVFYDITERKIAEKELKESEERHRSLNDSVLDAIIITNNVGQVISWNRGAEKIFGFDNKEALEMPINFIIPGQFQDDSKSGLVKMLNSIKNSSKGNIIEAEGINKKRELFPVEVSTSSWVIGEKRFYSAIVRDISERKTIEIKQNRLNEYLIKQNKQLEEFAHIASHNLRAPIANIESLLEFRESDDSEETSKFIFEQLSQVSGNLIETIDDLTEVLQTSWELNKKKQKLKFSQMFEKIINSLSQKIEDTSVVITHDFDAVDRITYPKVYLESIMQNLIQNAVKYRNPKKKSWVNVKTELTEKGIVLHVEDNGLGLDIKKHGKKLFGLRKTFHKNEDARGVGLFITKAQVTSMGGEIEVNSIVNKGSIFSVYFNVNSE